MSESFHNNMTALSAYNLYDALQHKSIDKCFEQLRNAIGKHRTSYSEIQNWFKEFKDDEQLDSDEDSEESDPEVTEFPILTDVVLAKIIEKCDLEQQLTLRKVSAQLRSLIDNQKPFFKNIQILCKTDHMEGVFNEKSVVYAGPEWKNEEGYGRSTVIKSEIYEEIAFDDVAIALKNPKLELDFFKFSFEFDVSQNDLIRRNFENIRNKLAGLDHNISVKNLQIRADTPDDILSILPFLKPEVLRTMEIDGRGSKDATWIDKRVRKQIFEIINSSQWKSIQEMIFRESLRFLPPESITGFKKIVIYEKSIPIGDFIQLREHLSLSNQFELCKIYCHGSGHEFEELSRYLGFLIPSQKQKCFICHYPCRFTNNMLEIILDMTTEWITIKKLVFNQLMQMCSIEQS